MQKHQIHPRQRKASRSQSHCPNRHRLVYQTCRNHEGSGLRGRRLPSQPINSVGHEGARRPLKPRDLFLGLYGLVYGVADDP
jgi:hypothetical protein